MTDFKELKSKCDAILGPYKAKEAALHAKQEQAVNILESLRAKVIAEGSYLSAFDVIARDVRIFNVCQFSPSVYLCKDKNDFYGTNKLGVYCSEVDEDYSKNGLFAIPVTSCVEKLDSYRKLEQSLVEEKADLELEQLKARGEKEKILRASLDLPAGVTAFATDDIADFKVVLTSDKSWHPCSECDNMTIGRIVDLQDKSDEENSLLVKQVCELILSLDKITGSCVIE